MRTALITGGTSGIGLSFARALAREGVDLVLVARDAARLDAVAADLRRDHGVDVDVVPADLGNPADVDAVAGRLRTGAVDVLVNNAGFSLKTPLVGGDDDLTDRAWQVMGRTPRVLAGAAAQGMLARPAGQGVPARRQGAPARDQGVPARGHIITIASISALTRQDSYSALKAYALALTEVLAVELTGTGIVVTAVLPGWTRTEFHDRGGQGRAAIPGWLWLDPDRVAAEGLRDAAAGRTISIPTRRYRVLAGLLSVLPRGGVRAVSAALAGHRRRDNRTNTAGGSR